MQNFWNHPFSCHNSLSPTDIPIDFSDPDDDYLLAYALIEEVDYIVTGDAALLALQAFGGVTIVDPRRFLAVLENKNRSSK